MKKFRNAVREETSELMSRNTPGRTEEKGFPVSDPTREKARRCETMWRVQRTYKQFVMGGV